MNYLAHSFLSNNNTDLIIGNFIADHIHGNNFENLSPGIIEGIKLHRKIDAFTDSHQKFKESKRFFYSGFEKYSGILVDIYFDHLLAKNYNNHTTVPLQEYCDNVYSIYSQNKNILPKSSQAFLNYVLQNNIYHAYSTTQGIEQVLFHLSHRINHPVKLHHSMDLFNQNIEQLQNNFELFFKDAVKEFM